MHNKKAISIGIALFACIAILGVSSVDADFPAEYNYYIPTSVGYGPGATAAGTLSNLLVADGTPFIMMGGLPAHDVSFINYLYGYLHFPAYGNVDEVQITAHLAFDYPASGGYGWIRVHYTNGQSSPQWDLSTTASSHVFSVPAGYVVSLVEVMAAAYWWPNNVYVYLDRCVVRQYVPAINSETEDFEALAWNVGVPSISGLIGSYDFSRSGTATNSIVSGQNLKFIDNTGGGGCGVDVTFSTEGSIGDTFMMKFRMTTAGSHNPLLFYEGMAIRIHCGVDTASGKWYYYTDAEGVVPFANCPYSSSWQTVEVKFLSTTQFQIRIDGGTWYTGNCRNGGFSGSTDVVTKWSYSGSTGNTYVAEVDDAQASWIEAIEDFEAPAWNVGVPLISGLIGSYDFSRSGTATNSIVSGQNLKFIDNTGSGGCGVDVTFSTAGSIGDRFKMKFRMTTAGSHNPLSFYEGTALRIHCGVDTASGKWYYYTDAEGVVPFANCPYSSSWQTVEVKFLSTTQFQIRIDGGTWYTGACRYAFSGSTGVVTKWSYSGSTGNTYVAEVDDVDASWLTS